MRNARSRSRLLRGGRKRGRSAHGHRATRILRVGLRRPRVEGAGRARAHAERVRQRLDESQRGGVLGRDRQRDGPRTRRRRLRHRALRVQRHHQLLQSIPRNQPERHAREHRQPAAALRQDGRIRRSRAHLRVPRPRHGHPSIPPIRQRRRRLRVLPHQPSRPERRVRRPGPRFLHPRHAAVPPTEPRLLRGRIRNSGGRIRVHAVLHRRHALRSVREKVQQRGQYRHGVRDVRHGGKLLLRRRGVRHDDERSRRARDRVVPKLRQREPGVVREGRRRSDPVRLRELLRYGRLPNLRHPPALFRPLDVLPRRRLPRRRQFRTSQPSEVLLQLPILHRGGVHRDHRRQNDRLLEILEGEAHESHPPRQHQLVPHPRPGGGDRRARYLHRLRILSDPPGLLLRSATHGRFRQQRSHLFHRQYRSDPAPRAHRQLSGKPKGHGHLSHRTQPSQRHVRRVRVRIQHRVRPLRVRPAHVRPRSRMRTG